MFSLWVCPDCRRVGRRGAVQPALSRPGGLSPDGEETHRPGGMAIAVSSWTCVECGQTGELVESRETTVEFVEPGVVAEVRRNPFFYDRRDAEPRPATVILSVMLVIALVECIALLAQFGQ